jgi:hypothetical protein
MYHILDINYGMKWIFLIWLCVALSYGNILGLHKCFGFFKIFVVSTFE